LACHRKADFLLYLEESKRKKREVKSLKERFWLFEKKKRENKIQFLTIYAKSGSFNYREARGFSTSAL